MTDDNKTKLSISAYIVKQFRNRNIFVFIFFLVLSSCLWFLNFVNKQHNASIEIPYKFENLPNKAKLSSENTSNLTVFIYGHGYNILREKIETVRLPVVIDLADKEIPVIFHPCPNNPLKSYILTNEIKTFISKRFGSNIQVTDIKPDTLFFDMAESFSKKVPVVFNAKYQINSGFLLNGDIVINPDSVFVYGPKHIIDTIKTAYCDNSEIDNIGDNHIKDVKLKYVRNLSYSKSKILLNFPVEKYTEAIINIPIVAVNFPDSLDYQLIPNKVNISYKVPLSLYDKIDSLNFEVVADYKTQKNKLITVNAISVNPYIEIIKINPFNVGFILKRRTNND